MILHLAIFTWRDGVSAADVEGLTNDLLDMAEAIPQIVQYRCGPTLGVRPGSGDYGVAAIVNSPEDLNSFLGHPLHTAVLERWMDHMLASRSSVQLPYEPGL